jgi:uncharacterized Fe-S center protein
MPSKVIFSESLSENFLSKLEKEIPFENETVAIKLHMGEPKNPNHLKPEEVKKFVDLLKKKNCKPFLFDTTVAYLGKRHSAKGYLEVAALNGFTEEKVGCPIVIGDKDYEVVKGKIEYQIPKEICNVSVLVLTHVKGHPCTSIGASIKNLGMGCVTKKTKSDIHDSAKPVYVGNCVLCGTCVKNCPVNAIKLDKILTKRPIFLDCWGCSYCTVVCPQKALKPKVAIFDFLLAEAAKSAISKFKKVYYVNFLVRMAERCDCENKELKPVIKDIGILASSDILAIEKASYDLIIEKNGKDVFKELNKKPFSIQLEAAKELNMGNMEYEIEKL